MSLKVDMEILFHGSQDQTNFGTQLIKLICKADMSNQAKLAKAFPNAVETVRHYQATGEILDLESD